jgi:hypothetical protein
MWVGINENALTNSSLLCWNAAIKNPTAQINSAELIGLFRHLGMLLWFTRDCTMLQKRLEVVCILLLSASRGRKRSRILQQIFAFCLLSSVWAWMRRSHSVFSTVSAHTRTPREDFWLKSSQLQTRHRDVCCSAICIKILVTGQANIFNLQAKHDFLAAAHSHKWKWKEFLLSGVCSLARSPPAPYYFRPVSLALTLNLSRMLALHVRQLTFIRERQPL